MMGSILWARHSLMRPVARSTRCTTVSRPIAGGVAVQHHARRNIFGGVGAGLYGMLVFVIITVFLAGLMVGRTPEYLGKKSKREVKWAAVAALAPYCNLVGTAIACVVRRLGDDQ